MCIYCTKTAFFTRLPSLLLLVRTYVRKLSRCVQVHEEEREGETSNYYGRKGRTSLIIMMKGQEEEEEAKKKDGLIQHHTHFSLSLISEEKATVVGSASN